LKKAGGRIILIGGGNGRGRKPGVVIGTIFNGVEPTTFKEEEGIKLEDVTKFDGVELQFSPSSKPSTSSTLDVTTFFCFINESHDLLP
jgi:hypothetical protein